MTKDLTPEAVETALEGATPGPWAVDFTYQWPSKVRAAPPFDDRWICNAGVMPSPKDQSHTLSNARLIAMAPDLAREYLRLKKVEAERDRLRAHISRMSAAGDKLDGWTSMEHVGAELARLNWKAVSRAALRNGEDER